MIGNDATHATNVFLYKDIGFDPVTSFAPITLAVRNIIGLAAFPGVPADDIAGLIAYGRAHPDKLSYGSSGTGSPHHLAGELLQQLTGIKLVHVPYRGGGPAVADLIAGQIPLVSRAWRRWCRSAKAGKVKILAVVRARALCRPARDPDDRRDPCRASRCRPGSASSRRPGTPAPIIATLNHAIVGRIAQRGRAAQARAGRTSRSSAAAPRRSRR